MDSDFQQVFHEAEFMEYWNARESIYYYMKRANFETSEPRCISSTSLHSLTGLPAESAAGNLKTQNLQP